MRIPSGIIPDLNRAKKKLDGCLVFKVDDGRDYFCTVDCKWIPQSLGESVFVLFNLPAVSVIGSVLPERFLEIDNEIKKGLVGGSDPKPPKQLSRLVNFINEYGKSVVNYNLYFFIFIF